MAFGGVGLPLVLAMLLRPKHFPLWYVVQLVKGISVLAILLSLISLIGCKYGVIVENDDIMNAVRLWPEGRGFVLFCCVPDFCCQWAASAPQGRCSGWENTSA